MGREQLRGPEGPILPERERGEALGVGLQLRGPEGPILPERERGEALGVGPQRTAE